MELSKFELDDFLHDNAHKIRRWVYNGLDMAANSTTALFQILMKCDDESIKKCLTNMGLKPFKTADGDERFDYFVMLKRNIEFVRILRNRRLNYGKYHDYDLLFTAMSDDYRIGKMDDCVRNNEEFERAILKKLYKENDIGMASDSETESHTEESFSKDSSESPSEDEEN